MACKAYVGLAVLAMALCASTAQAQSEASASIIQTTIMSFRVTGSAASNFSMQTQQAFSDNLRSLLSSYNFMSLAVSDFKIPVQAIDGYVDVSVRAVDATDAENCTSKWQKIASQNVASGTFMPTFNALLGNSGFQGSAQLISVLGATTPAGVNVSFAVNLTLSGGSNLLPFSSSKQDDLLVPINSFLGDHGNASINTTVEGMSNVAAMIDVTLDANTMPQFWFFIYNQTTLQASLPSLGGSSLNTTVGNYTVLGSAATPTPAPVPQASAPISQAPANGPITAQQVTQVPSVPPVSSSSSGTVTMNIAMTLYGSSVQPFTSDKQFAAASALAGVFWIIVGTGSVNVISFNTISNTTRTASTARATVSQYSGRRLLQSADVAENVVFAVTLPTASQNSLLVLQSSSDTVRQQFAGWFVTQMQARGYNVDADVTDVQISTVTPSSASVPPPAASVTTSPSSSGGSDSHVGAIVGGVVGGVCGLALIATVAAFIMLRRKQKHKLDMAHMANGKGVMMTSSSSGSEDMKAAVFWGAAGKGARHPVYSKDAEDLKKTIASTLGADNPNLQPNSNLWGSPLYSKMSDLDNAHQEGIKMLLHKRRQQVSQALTETSANQAEALISALSSLEIGSLYYDKYIVEQGQRRGINSIVAYARVKEDPSQEVVIKFLPDHGYFKHESLFYENRQALEGEDAALFIPVMFDAFSGSMVIHTEDDDAIPPSLVLERGSFTLTDYFTGQASLQGKPEEVDRSQILYHAAKCVEFMHARNLVHGALTPDSLMWFSGEKKWKMIGFGNWARTGEAMAVNYDLRHAAPELVLADLGRMTTMAASSASDMWALGCIAFELLTGKDVFSGKSDEEVMSMLIGFVKLPWEEDSEFFANQLQPNARGLIADLLHRSPDARKPIRTFLHSPLFLGDAKVDDKHVPDTLRTPDGIFSTNSEWL